MKILILGSGGREHAIAYKCAQSSHCERVFVAPGNAGTHREPKIENVNIDILDFDALSDFAKSQNIAFTIVGPEAPLVEGIVDYFEQRQLKIIGPSQYASQLEGSKSFAKQFMLEHNIPTAKAKSFHDTQEALAYLQTCQLPVVIKADGLAAGKGVIIANSMDEAKNAITSILDNNKFGDAGNSILIEDFLHGEEASFIVLCDGEHILPFASSQDHKRRDNNDKGPNTGGMGAYSPAPIIDRQREHHIIKTIIQPVVDGMKAKGHPFKGFLYAGLMISDEGKINVLEFNVRFGDPETQPILMRLQSDFVDICLHALHGELDRVEAKWDPRHALGVVLAANGYPGNYSKDDSLNFLNDIPKDANRKLFHAGTTVRDGTIYTCGGRVLCATALGDPLSQAYERAYKLVNLAKWDNAYFRTDIGHKAL